MSVVRPSTGRGGTVSGRGHRLAGRLASIAAAGAVLAGCQAQIDAAGEPGDTRVLVSRSSSALVISAPEWRPPQTLVYLCPTAPTKTVVGLVDAGTISLSADCVTYGLVDTARGLETTLGYGTIDAARRPIFDSAPDWHLVLIGIRDGAADRVFRTAISPVPIDPSITPGPAQPLPSTPSPGSSPSAGASTGQSVADVARPSAWRWPGSPMASLTTGAPA
jgi:hypothetical protein